MHVATAAGVPAIHANADDAEAVVRVVGGLRVEGGVGQGCGERVRLQVRFRGS
jgi:hypothetical protein